MKSTLSELSYKVYTYLNDMKYFAKTIRDKGYEDNDIKEILIDAKKLYDFFLSAIDKDIDIEQYNELTEAKKTAEIIMNDLKNISCLDEFIYEKTDLIVEAFAIKEKTSVYLNQILKKKDA